MVSPTKTLAIHTFGRLCSGSVCSSCSSDLSTSPKMVGYWLLIFFNLLNILFVLVDSLLFYYEVALFHLLIGDCCCRRSSAETVDGTSTAVAMSSSSAAQTAANVAPRFEFLLLWFFFSFFGFLLVWMLLRANLFIVWVFFYHSVNSIHPSIMSNLYPIRLCC